MKMINNNSQNLIYECDKDFYLFSAGSASKILVSINIQKKDFIAVSSIDLNSIFSIDRSSVNPIFFPKNAISTLITDSEIGEEIKFPSISNKVFEPEFFDEITESKRFLELEDNWDDLGSKSYKLETWVKMKDFLLKFAQDFYSRSSLILPVPYINPGKASAFDLHWKTKSFELLLRIPEEHNVPISFYGDNYENIKIRGTLEKSKLDSLIEWIRLYF
ncbi:hypothetical protein LCGC14_1138350 [marine sediment metagenome]|uniref:Uncharacterized protein n=1 Tax=marine sediment metagenome TaxID=412755 RepID=A0A0F9MLY6_9ZZZZ